MKDELEKLGFTKEERLEKISYTKGDLEIMFYKGLKQYAIFCKGYEFIDFEVLQAIQKIYKNLGWKVVNDNGRKN